MKSEINSLELKKIFVSYKQWWLEESELDNNLGFLRWKLNNLNYENFIYYFDKKFKNISAEEINQNAFNEINKADIVLWLINNKQKSEGQLLELWMAYAMWKKIILLVNEKVKENYFLSFWLKSDIIYFNELKEIDFKKIFN